MCRVFTTLWDCLAGEIFVLQWVRKILCRCTKLGHFKFQVECRFDFTWPRPVIGISIDRRSNEIMSSTVVN